MYETEMQTLGLQIELLNKELKGKTVKLVPAVTEKLINILRTNHAIIERLSFENAKLTRSKQIMDLKLTACTNVMTQEQKDRVFPVKKLPTGG